jgi:N-acetylglucosaminyldiphosphoundecaprenol N-acetyl-beta-D-mannosaminyltransferase
MQARMQPLAAALAPATRVNVLGVAVSAINMNEALERIVRALESKEKGYVCVTGVHGISEAQSDPGFRRILNKAFLCTPDGMPLVWVGRLRGAREMDRVYGPDLMLAIMDLSERMGWRHFFYGGANGTVELLKTRLLARFPKVQIAGTYEPPFRPLNAEELEQLQERVRLARPDVMWIGLSTPKQERFMAEFIHKLDTKLMLGVGAAFDIHAGLLKDSPTWVKRAGLQWVHRLYQEPRRLCKRYLVNNPKFVLEICLQLAGVRKDTIPQHAEGPEPESRTA